ncbi:MAG TPA: HNH endonuclease [Ramlibacter sp.]|nr:HNH endonuclease [Ramlibacter sp.]
MRVIDYLQAKYGVGSATTLLYCEAKALGIPYPPPSGWLRTYGAMEITADAAERLRVALEKSKKPSAARGLEVLRNAWLTLKKQPSANADDFLKSKAWKRLRFQALKKYGMRCQACGASPASGAVLNVDHILPRRLFPEMALQLDNLQVLCGTCNEGKGNWDMTDARKAET